MGLKDLAALAVQAEDAERKKQKAVNRRTHATAAEAAVQQHLELTGRCVKAHEWTPEEKAAQHRADYPSSDPRPYGWGDGATVVVEDDDMSLTILVAHESRSRQVGTYYNHWTYGPLEWKFTVTRIDGIDLTDGMDGESGYKSRPSLRWNDVRFIPSREAYDKRPPINEVRSLADVGRLIAAWEAFKEKRDAHLARQRDGEGS